ncbi:hypothetical protein Taro_022283 [Colocasia esculenta]|uniref:Putative plant transposon protein domain-containing protein n=1 Tax=Colocasia esculenta TaxID=4460 RepID=A0A843VAV6_COLES|nr:hypothetical protein [Colocasia esculenta]
MAASTVSGSLGDYSAEFLTPEQQERFTFVKAKLYGNKEVDIADLEKNGMHSVVAAIIRMQWMGIATLSEVSYPDLVKAFYVCLKSKADGSLTSFVKGIQIRIDREFLKTLVGVCTSGQSGIHSVDIQAKGLGIIGTDFRLKDGKLDINQLNAFNRILHFIVCQTLAPRNATFSSCAKADSDLMFWAIQNREINMAEVMIERMKFARDQIWDTKSKLNVSLPYAHLLTKVFKHFGVDLSGAVTEKMGQAIRSINLKKSGFSFQNGTWSKASVVEGEAIIGDFPVVQKEAAESAVEQPVAVQSATVEALVAIEPAAPSAPELARSPLIEALVEEAVESAADPLPTSIVASILEEVLDSIHSTPVTPEAGGESVAEAVASGHIEESLAIPVQEEQLDAPNNIILEEDAPIQGEQEPMEKDAPVQGEQSKEGPVEETRSDEPMGSVPTNEDLPNAPNDARDGETASSSDSDDDQPPPTSEARHKGKEVESEVPLLSNTPFERQMRQKILINLKLVIERLDAQGTILCSLQSDVSSIFMSQASASKEISNIRNAMKWFNKEMGSMKNMLCEILKVVGAEAPPPPPPAAQVPESRPAGPSVQESGPSGPSGPAEQVSGPTGPLESKPVQTEVEEEVLAPKPPAPSHPSHTPVPPSPLSAPTAPPAPQPFKKPQSRPISSPTRFPSQSTSSPASSIHILPPPPISKVPPASSAGASSSSGPSPGLVDDIPTTSHSFLHPSPPPSFITIIPETAQLDSPFIEKIKDEFEEGILRSVLKVREHIHRADSSSPAPKKRKISSTSSISYEPKYPPLWFSLTVVTKNKPLYREYLSKVVLATIINLPFLNLTEHLHTILPFTSISKSKKSKIFSSAHSKIEEQWGKGHKDLFERYILAKSTRFPLRDHSLTLSEWFRIYHRELWAPFIQKEIKMVRHYVLFNNYRYVHRLPEVQLSQFKRAISALTPGISQSSDIQVDFATLHVPDEIALPQIHFHVMESSVGSIIFECFARVMGRIQVQKGYLVAFPRFLFREYHQGHVSAEVLAPILSECERLTSSEWSKFYPLSAQQLFSLNEAQAREGKPAISPATFLDMNSINLINDPFKVWEERYKVYLALHKALKDNHNHYPVSMDQFLTCASFGTRHFLKMTMDKEAYADLLYKHLDLHLQRMASSMGPTYSVSFGVFKTHFEEQEAQAWETISHFASLLSPAYYLFVPPQH